jgi:hypothetical protein
LKTLPITLTYSNGATKKVDILADLDSDNKPSLARKMACIPN